jgi:toxin ParE1/3/4
MIELELLPQAEQDIRALWAYIAEENPAAATRVAQGIFDTLDRLLEQPRMGTPRPELADDLRAMVSGSYVIFYRPLAYRIQVARILHGRRDLHADLF